MRICSLYGAGFYYIPGTDTCIKLGGYLRAEVAVNATDFNGNFSGVNGSANRLTNYYVTRAREDFNVDTRTATEYGVVRTFADVVFSWTTDNYTGNGTGNGSTVYSQLGAHGRWRSEQCQRRRHRRRYARRVLRLHPVRGLHDG